MRVISIGRHSAQVPTIILSSFYFFVQVFRMNNLLLTNNSYRIYGLYDLMKSKTILNAS